MKRNKVVSGLVVVLIVMSFVLVSCGGGGGGSSAPACTTCSNVAGTWYTTEIVHSTTCSGSFPRTEHNYYTVTQNGCNLTVTTSGLTFNGQICDNTLSWSGSYPDDGGTTAITSSSFTLSGATFTGTANWTWSGSGSSCSGYTDTTATKQ